MKKTSIIINVVLILGLIVLYILHFTGNKESTGNVDGENAADKDIQTVAATPVDSLGKPVRIAYVNTDTILMKYKYFQELERQLEVKQNNAEYQLSQKMKNLETDYKNLMSKIKLGLITETEAEQDFALKQQEVEQYRLQVREDLLIAEQRLTEQLYDSIVGYIHRYNEQANYAYILGYSKGGGILYAEDTYDLTNEVIEGLNSEYDIRKKKNTAKPK